MVNQLLVERILTDINSNIHALRNANYRDTFLVLAENGIINTEHLNIYEKMAAFRNLIVHYYERIDDEVVFGIFKKNLKDFELFITEILQFMQK